MLGSVDGRIRVWDREAKNDDTVAINARVMIGPLAPEESPYQTRFTRLRTLLSSNQEGCAFRFFATDTPDVLGVPVYIVHNSCKESLEAIVKTTMGAVGATGAALVLEDGTIAVPSAPGLGVTLDEEIVAKLRQVEVLHVTGEVAFTDLAAQARAQGFTFPYAYDESQAVAKAYTAACTPDCRRMAAAMAIMAPLSVHRCSSG